MNEDIVLKLERVTKKIRNRKIVDSLSFEVHRGEVFGLLGPNGAGKTTAIRMMVGLMSITEGEIWINGFNVRTHFEDAMRHVGAIVENPEFYKFLSGYRNLVHFARMNPGVPAERIDEAVELVGLKNRIGDKVKTYSLGMRQRLGIAQAVLHRPKLLILDEPTNGLDPAGIRELRDYLRRLAREEGIAVVVSSHLLSEMELMCDRVAIIQNGRLIDVRPVKGNGKELETRAQMILFDIDRSRDAAEAIRKWTGSIPKVQEDGKIAAVLEREQIPELAARLVSDGFRLYGIRPVEKSLEDQFLEVTRGGQIE